MQLDALRFTSSKRVAKAALPDYAVRWWHSAFNVPCTGTGSRVTLACKIAACCCVQLCFPRCSQASVLQFATDKGAPSLKCTIESSWCAKDGKAVCIVKVSGDTGSRRTPGVDLLERICCVVHLAVDGVSVPVQTTVTLATEAAPTVQRASAAAARGVAAGAAAAGNVKAAVVHGEDCVIVRPLYTGALPVKDVPGKVKLANELLAVVRLKCPGVPTSAIADSDVYTKLCRVRNCVFLLTVLCRRGEHACACVLYVCVVVHLYRQTRAV